MSRFSFEKADLEFSFTENTQSDTIEADSLPARLKKHSQWIVTKNKAPSVPSEKWQMPEKQLSFSEAQQEAMDVKKELAFCFVESGPFIGVDLDDVAKDGVFSDEARSIVERLQSYTEVSTSGTGLHIIAEGERLPGRYTRADLSEWGHLEVYDAARYFVLTGEVYEGRTSITNYSKELHRIQATKLPEKLESNDGERKPMDERDFSNGRVSATPQQVRKTIETYVKDESSNVDDELLHLWEGRNEGRQSTSEADMAFVKQLYYWCKGDLFLVDDCFRSSGRARPKWDEVHYADGDTYGEMTLRRVSRTSNDTFNGAYVNVRT